MFCRKCGKEIRENALFCTYCGEKVAVPKTEQKKSWKLGILIAVLIIVLAAAGFILAKTVVIPVISNMDNQQEQDATDRENDADEEESTDSKKNEDEEESTDSKKDVEEETTEADAKEEKSEESKQQESAEKGAFSQSELALQIREMNTQGNAVATIDIDAANYQPATRNYDAAWDMMLFYTLEDTSPENDADGQINRYNIQKKELVNADTGRTVEYNIYSHPQSGIVNKIVSIEQESGQLLVCEYYYTDDGKANFIFEYTDVNYFPSYATPNRDGNRYYFDNDVLAKWRVVSGGNQTNYVIGAKAAEAGANAGEVIEYASLGTDVQAAFDENEKRMINAAYNTYNTVLNSKGINIIQGYVYNAEGAGIDQVTVDIRQPGEELSSYQTATGSDGAYCIYVPSDARTYELTFHKDNCEKTVLYNLETNEQNIGNYQPAIYMIEGNSEYEVSIKLCDALNFDSSGQSMLPLSGASYVIRRGVNCIQGEEVQSGQADENGIVYGTLPVGMYTMQVSKEGYDDAYFSLVVKQEETVQYNVSPTLNVGEVRVVLTWGSTPRDLDSHLFTPYCTTQEHISFYYQTDVWENNLDVDETTGYGPETVTITNLDTQGLYKYYVADYTNCSSGNFDSTEMSMSEATVNVYNQSGLVATFYVPVNRPGVIWEVFEIRNGVIIPAQRYYQTAEDKDWWSSK